MSQLFASGGQNIGVSASTSVLPMNTPRTGKFSLIISLTMASLHVFLVSLLVTRLSDFGVPTMILFGGRTELHCIACGILVPHPGVNTGPQQ